MQLSAGDARRALTALEVAAETAGAGRVITVDTIEQSLDKAAVRYDRDGDQHYDVISAFIKSIRGSDVDAALHTWPGCWPRARIPVSSPAGW